MSHVTSQYIQGGNILIVNAVMNRSMEKSIEIFSHLGSRQVGAPRNTLPVMRATTVRMIPSMKTSVQSVLLSAVVFNVSLVLRGVHAGRGDWPQNYIPSVWGTSSFRPESISSFAF